MTDAGEVMTDISEDTIANALIAIDEGLGQFASRNMVTTAEVTDLLLDLRTLLTTVEEDGVVDPVPAGV